MKLHKELSQKKDKVSKDLVFKMKRFNWLKLGIVVKHYLTRCMQKSSGNYLKYRATLPDVSTDMWQEMKRAFKSYQNHFISKLLETKKLIESPAEIPPIK